ncbi:MAG: enediyne biosynthesis protein UnbU [Anaerolineae bacterium]|nr:enediyne biosynthesis protein UnbU [Anaerolineae bacterium]
MSKKKIDYRLAALWRFAIAISTLNLLGHFYLGFEQSWAQPLVGLATAYILEFGLEILSAWGDQRPPRFKGGRNNLLSFILPAHITGLAVPMLLYANDQLWPIAMATAIAIGSKYIFRVRVGPHTQHFLNPSNTGIAVTLLLFPWVGIAPPYHFTENVAGFWDWALPGLIIISGSYLNANFTKRIPLILGWLGGFVLQAVIRSLILGTTPLISALLPMTGLAFILFTFYMISDPGTTPFSRKAQLFFGAAVAATYGLLVTAHIVFGIFFALIIVCTMRGMWLYAQMFFTRPIQTPAEVSPPVIAGANRLGAPE